MSKSKKTGKDITWIKLDLNDANYILDPEGLEEMTEEEKEIFFAEVGKVFIDTLSFFASGFSDDFEWLSCKNLKNRPVKRFARYVYKELNTSIKNYQYSINKGIKGAEKRWGKEHSDS